MLASGQAGVRWQMSKRKEIVRAEEGKKTEELVDKQWFPTWPPNVIKIILFWILENLSLNTKLKLIHFHIDFVK